MMRHLSLKRAEQEKQKKADNATRFLNWRRRVPIQYKLTFLSGVQRIFQQSITHINNPHHFSHSFLPRKMQTLLKNLRSKKKCSGAYGFKKSPPILGGVAEGRGGND